MTDFEKREYVGRLILHHFDFQKETMDIKLTDTQRQYIQDVIDDMSDEIKGLAGEKSTADLRYNLSVFNKVLEAASCMNF